MFDRILNTSLHTLNFRNKLFEFSFNVYLRDLQKGKLAKAQRNNRKKHAKSVLPSFVAEHLLHHLQKCKLLFHFFGYNLKPFRPVFSYQWFYIASHYEKLS